MIILYGNGTVEIRCFFLSSSVFFSFLCFSFILIINYLCIRAPIYMYICVFDDVMASTLPLN